MATSTHLPLCIYCGTARPADETRCPHCGRPWIDIRIGESAEHPVPVMAGVAASGVTKETSAPAPPPPPLTAQDVGHTGGTTDHGSSDGPSTDPSHRFVWLIPSFIAAIAVVVIALFFFGVLDGGGQATALPSTSLPPSTSAPTTTSTAPTTTAAAVAPATTTSITTPPTTIPHPRTLEPVGDPIPYSSLTLRAGGIGPLAFGTSAADVVGRLVSSIGEPSETGSTDERLGLCADDDGRFIRWDGLTVVTSGTIAEGTFVGYRYDAIPTPTMQLELSTPSGLRVGDSVATLNQIYSSYRVDYVTAAGTDMFRLSDGDGLLLWGPVTSIEDSGRVQGIRAPEACSN